MKAAVLRAPKNLNLEDVENPQAKEDELLIKVKACGLCGTDIEMYEGTNKEGTFPFIPGHEWSGEVVEVGEKVKTFKKGDRVVAEPFIPCGLCYSDRDGQNVAFCPTPLYYGFTWTTPGGLAEYTKAREIRTHKIPSNVTYDEGALVEPLSVSYHGIWGVGGGVAPHDNVVVFGAGPIGLLALAIVKVSGAKAIMVSMSGFEKRIKLAEKMGADVVITPQQGNIIENIRSHTDGVGASLIIEASGGNTAIRSLMDASATSGRIVLIGHSIGREIPIEIGKSIWKGLTIVGACDSPHFFPKTLRFLSRKLVDVTPMITHRFPLSDVLEAFELGVKRTESAKILVEP